MLAIDRSGLVVVDLVHLHVVVPTTIAMSGGPATALAVGAEQSITATVRANGEDGGAPVPVAGVAATFAVADETVAAILSQRDGVARIVGRRVGQTELTAVLPGDNGELKTRVSIRVEGALPADGGTDATVGSTDAGITEGGADAK